MAHILIQNEKDPQRVIAVRLDINGDAFGLCPRCWEMISDRGHFQDTIEAVGIHVDGKCLPR